MKTYLVSYTLLDDSGVEEHHTVKLKSFDSNTAIMSAAAISSMIASFDIPVKDHEDFTDPKYSDIVSMFSNVKVEEVTNETVLSNTADNRN